MARLPIRVAAAKPPVRRRLRPAGSLLAGFFVVFVVGCESRSSSLPAEDSAPPVPVAPATPPEGISAAELRRRLGANENARFDRTGDEITHVELHDSGVTDLTPLKGLPLEALGISGLAIDDLSPLSGMSLTFLTAENTQIEDLTPLKGMPLKEVYLRETPVRDLSPLADCPIEQLNVVGTRVTDVAPVKTMPLGTLWIASTKVNDLSPLAGKSLQSLDLEDTPVTDLSVLAEMTSLKRLNIARSAVTDLTPVAGLRLERLIFTPSRIVKGLEAVRAMPSLQNVGTTFDEVMPPAQFWARYDAGDFKEPAPAARE